MELISIGILVVIGTVILALLWYYIARQVYKYVYWESYSQHKMEQRIQAAKREQWLQAQELAKAANNAQKQQQDSKLVALTYMPNNTAATAWWLKIVQITGWRGFGFLLSVLDLPLFTNHEQHLRIQSMKYAIKHFLKRDGVAVQAFVRTFMHMHELFTATYQHANGTKTEEPLQNLPVTYPFWFVAGYPHIFAWFVNQRTQLNSVVYQKYGDPIPQNYLVEGQLIAPVLRNIIDLYNSENQKV